MPAANPGSNGQASLVYFYFGDNFFTTLMQEAGVNLNLCTKDYKETIILKEDDNNGIPISLDRRGDDTPTQANFIKYAQQLADAGYFLDVFIFAHGGRSDIAMKGEDLSDGDLTRGLGEAGSGYPEFPMRMVYQMNCWGQSRNQTWRSVGAKTVAGARYVNFYPNQFNEFCRHWNDGVAFSTALTKSNDASSRTVFQALIVAQAAITFGEHGGCGIGKTVLGSAQCAKDFFVPRYLNNSEWQSGKSGKENMNHASHKVRAGNEDITKRSTPTWS